MRFDYGLRRSSPVGSGGQKELALPFPMPGPEQGRIMRVLPTVISLLDYTQGFGHADLVAC